MVDLAKGNTDLSEFTTAMQDQMGDFDFPEDFISDIWSAVAVKRGTSF